MTGLQDLAGLVHNAKNSGLLVEVDTDEVHGRLLVWKHVIQDDRPRFTTNPGHPTRPRATSAS
jgi:hypothetical protein